MIFTGIKRKSNQLFFNKKVKELLGDPAESTSEKIKKVLIVLDDISLKEVTLANLKNNLGIQEKNIEILVFLQKKSKEKDDKHLFSSKDFGWYGKINNDILKNILTKKYDLLINYSKVDNLYNNLLLLHCKVDFRVGFAIFDNRLYDLLIDCKPENLSLFNKELKKYLEILNGFKFNTNGKLGATLFASYTNEFDHVSGDATVNVAAIAPSICFAIKSTVSHQELVVIKNSICSISSFLYFFLRSFSKSSTPQC